jgi:hypothetical protein
MKIRKLRSHNNFLTEITQIEVFWKSTIYAYEETERLLKFWKSKGLEYDEVTEFDYAVSKPKAFNLRSKAKNRRRDNLNSMLFVRLISALEVFLVDLLKDAFQLTKDPFKNNDLRIEMSHAEILSIKSPNNFYDKIISKECRKLSSAGFEDIVKYYKKHFKIDLANFSPGIYKMTDYHDRRHLIVHRLGETDPQYRKKHNTREHAISIDDDYILGAISEIKSYCKMVHDQMVYQLKNHFLKNEHSQKKSEIRTLITVTFNDPINGARCFVEDFEFLSEDKYYLFSDILDHRSVIDSNTIEYLISGSESQIENYISIIKQEGKKLDFKAVPRKVKADIPKWEQNSNRTLDEILLTNIEEKLPAQPWGKGIHKEIAKVLDVSNKLVSIGIQQLIAQGKFKSQLNGDIIDD